jgi:predicted ATP-grasp superfamily ATP-dependent carboligase
MKDIVIFAGSAIGSVLSIAHQTLKKYPIRTYVICLNSNYSAVFRSSRFITESIEIYAETDSCLFEKFKSWTAKKRFAERPVLYATTDNSCVFIDNYREWFSTNFELTIPSHKIISTYNYKGLAEIDAQLNGLTIPKTKIIKRKADILEIIDKYNFPVIIKPTSYSTKLRLGFKTKTFYEKEPFVQYIESSKIDEDNIICQEYILGRDDKVYYYIFYRDNQGNIFENIGIKKLQSPPGAGIMAIGISDYNETISRISKDFLKNIDYIGIGGIEYKEYRGKYYFIEMSTRAEGFFMIAEASNVPISKIAYQTLSGVAIRKKFKQINGIEYIDIIPTFSARRIEHRMYLFFLKDIIEPIFSAKGYFNMLTIIDIKPFITLIKRIIK